MLQNARVVFSATSRQGVFTLPRRGFAENPNDIAKRIASTKSIQKITKSMKMVSAAKLRGDTQRLMQGRTFGSGLKQVLVTGEAREGEELHEFKKPLYVMITSDRGLCGGVNGFVAKKVKAQLEEDIGSGLEPKVFIVGDKGAPLMQRTHGNYVIGSISEPWKIPMNFSKAMAIAERVLSLAEAEQSDIIKICFNRFVNSIKYETEFKEVPIYSKLIKGENEGETLLLPVPLNRYEMEYENTIEAVNNIMEYALAVQLYGCSLESATSEQSSKCQLWTTPQRMQVKWLTV
jgi:F-type H+-transporting ATPase subunit gamma